MAGISKAERERRASQNAPQATIPVKVDRDYLTALCAALPFSGKQIDPWTPLTFEDRLAAAKVNARLILDAAREA